MRHRARTWAGLGVVGGSCFLSHSRSFEQLPESQKMVTAALVRGQTAGEEQGNFSEVVLTVPKDSGLWPEAPFSILRSFPPSGVCHSCKPVS